MRVIVLFVALILFRPAFAGNLLDVRTLNERLKEQNAGWVAKETPLSRISKTEAKRMMGLIRKSAPDVQFVDTFGFTSANLPAKLDWRNRDGINWVSPILNQANCGSCVAFAAIGVMETQLNIGTGIPNTHVRLSPQNLFACGGGYCDFGWMPESAARQLQKYGVPDEACMPYTSGATGQDVACNASCGDTKTRSMKIAGYTTPTRSLRNIESVKSALQKGPVVTTLTVYADFLSYASGVYKHVEGDELGGHAISIVGYDDNERAWIIRNSWGEDWGENGFGRVSYDDISGVSDETWSYKIPAGAGTVTLESPLDYSFVTGSLSVRGSTSFEGDQMLSATLIDPKGQSIDTQASWAPPEAGVLDVSKMMDGRYEIFLTSKDLNGNALGRSVRHMFYVVNSKPKMSLSFKGHDVDLGQDLSERIEFEISAKTSSVPMSSLQFHFRGPNGVEHTRTANIVLSEMTMGWRTNVLPNGKYEIWFVGHLETNNFKQMVESDHMIVNLKN